MNEGVLMQVGTPSELYERPADAFVAGFLGDPPMNLFEAVLEHGGGGARLRHDHWRLPLAWSPAGATGRTVTVGIRAQDISLGAPTTQDAAGFRGRCELVEYLGSHVLVHVRVGEDEIVLLDDPTTGVSAGDLVDGRVRSDRVHLFDKATGRALAPTGYGLVADRVSSTSGAG
jgi:multiple sugar transport system ATP-binding protein